MIKGDISNVSAPELWIEAGILYGKKGNWLFPKYEYERGALDWLVKLTRSYKVKAFTFESKGIEKVRKLLEEWMTVETTDELEIARKLDRSDNIAKVYVTKETKNKLPQGDDRVIEFNGWGDR